MADAAVKEKVEAFVYRKLRDHLQNNPSVQNIDLMNLAGFCRNCLSKWYYLGASKLGVDISYDDACTTVYKVPYKEWKSLHQKEATLEQLEQFKSKTELHAKHPNMEEVAQEMKRNVETRTQKVQGTTGPVMSDVCCEDPESMVQTSAGVLEKLCRFPHSGTDKVPDFKLGILTVSDRASAGLYEDLSGPEIEILMRGYQERTKYFCMSSVCCEIVPDEHDTIVDKLIEMADKEKCDLIITTGGTGLSKRDVTPEATKVVVDRLVQGIPEAIRRETSKVEPLAMLSRAVAGIRNNNTLIVNLPGRPKAVRESMVVLLPVLPHAVSQLQK